MKKAFFIILMAFSLVACNNDIYKAIEDLNNKIDELDGRVSQLEELCKEMNTNISSLQTIVNVILTNDYIISVVPVTKDGEEIGYVITFAQHEPITIYHGQNGKDGEDGKDGQNGKDGKDGKDGVDGQDAIAPIVSVKLDSIDGAYYWTIDGQWLINENNERVPVTSKDGKDGQDGKNGQDGHNGQDGITPQLKIEDGYWYVSYDHGTSWTMLYKAVGDDGQNGQDGQDGDSMFSSVTQDDEFVYFTLINGTILKVPLAKVNDGSVPTVDGAIMAEFSVSASTKVYFSMGNLQYNATQGTHQCADGTTKNGTWRFAENQWDYSSTGWNSTFTWGESGYNNNGASIYSDISSTYYDWGTFNAISNGGNQPNQWRVLTADEFNYLLFGRPNADNLKQVAIINRKVVGLILLPDSCLIDIDGIPLYLSGGQIYGDPFELIQSMGAIFIPLTTYSYYSSETQVYSGGLWTGTFYFHENPYAKSINIYVELRSFNYIVSRRVTLSYSQQNNTLPVRLVKDVQ